MKQFFRITAAVLAAAFLLALTGCGSSSSAPSFTWFVDTIPANLDPQVASAAPDVIACENLYSGLVRKKADGEIVPDLSESWTISSDGKTYTFQIKDGAVNALKDIDLTIPDGSIYGIIGMSGAGKSTLVRCINLLERPTEGSVVIDGTAMETLSPAALRERRRDITMIFQQFNLLMQRSCLKNICFPMELAGVKKADAEKRARELLEMVGLPDKANAYPAQLSGGQKQRIAIARALATNPKVLLCDEATSALDPNTTHAILTLIKDINKKLGITVVVITHQMSVVEEVCNRVAILDNGTVVEEGEVQAIFSHPTSKAARRLVYPAGAPQAEVLPGHKLVRVAFVGTQTTDKPLVASLAIECGALVSIMGADTRIVNGLCGNPVL